MNDFEALEKTILPLLHSNLKPSRLEHSLSVAKTAEILCTLYGEDPKKGHFVGLVHDMCKYFSEQELLKTAEQDTEPVPEYEKSNPELLHGRCAAVVLKNKYKVTDNSILFSIKHHTLGHKDLDNLGKILYVADKIEPTRPQMTTEKFAEYQKLSLNQLIFAVLKESLDYNRKQGNKIPLVSLEFYDCLKGKNYE